MISAMVLAAGMSTRMGGPNKLLLPFRGTTLVASMVGRVARADVGETLVVLGHEAERVRAALSGVTASGLRVTLVDNPAFAEGQGSSVQAGVRRVSPAATGIMICLTDLPLVETEELNLLIAAYRRGAAGGKTLVVPTHDGQRGNPVLFSARYREEVLATRGPVAGCRGLVKRYPERVLEVELPQDHVLRDLDTPQDYRRLLTEEAAGAEGTAAADAGAAADAPASSAD